MSNKTPKAKDVKTGSARNSFFLIAAALLVALLVWTVLRHRNSAHQLKLGPSVFTYALADTEVEREQGLSGRTSLANNQAMLFAFPAAGSYCFWMKDMHFSLDMLWLDSQKRVVYVKENATPDSYPASFCPDKSSQYVIEVGAGQVRKSGVKIGDRVRF